MITNDPYMQHELVVERLITEWNTHGKLVIGLDIDNTVHDYYGKGYTYKKIIGLIRICKEIGAHITVCTCRDESEFSDIRGILDTDGIPYDSINENPSFITFTGKKPYYNILLDDRAGLSSAYHALLDAAMIRKAEITFVHGKEVEARSESVSILKRTYNRC